MDAHPLGAAPRRRPFQRLVYLFTLPNTIFDFFVTFPFSACTSTTCVAGGGQINAGATCLRQITDEETRR